MSQKRRDSKGRVLHTGEGQDKNGRYFFRYTDTSGERQTVYAWKLTDADRTPSGKREDLCLREKEKAIQKNLDDGISNKKRTVAEVVEEYLSTKDNQRISTKEIYQYVLKSVKNDDFGKMTIDTLSVATAKNYFKKLKDEKGLSYSSINSFRSVLRPAFQYAYEEEWVRRNFFDFKLSNVIKNEGKESRDALTPEQQQTFLDFIQSEWCYREYYDAIFILLNTGVRISEFCGLTVANIDIANKILHIDHQLKYQQDAGYYIEPPKSSAGKRDIPITSDVTDCFKRIIEKRKDLTVDPMIDGQVGFLYVSRRNNMPLLRSNWQNYLRDICKTYNATHDEKLPQITPHVLRHTYCTNMVRQNMPVKTLQYLMGHSKINMTMDVYTHLNCEDVRTEVERIESLSKTGTA